MTAGFTLDGVVRATGALTERVAALTTAAGRRVALDPAMVLAGPHGPGALTGGAAVVSAEERPARVLAARDGWVAVTLARPDDVAAVDAIVGARGASANPWPALSASASVSEAAEFVARAQLVGVPAAVVQMTPVAPVGLVGRVVAGDSGGDETAAPRALVGITVVDLSALWAGPLCAHVLGRAGARVVKVESVDRPDGGRADPSYFAQLHAGHEFVALDFASPGGRAALARLIGMAGIVIEASRPRALAQLGIDAAAEAESGATWVSITGYGRSGPQAGWVAFGDDAAAAGGLMGRTASGAPSFLAPALADPVTGLFAAIGALESWRRGKGEIVDVAMRDCAAWVAARAASLMASS